MARNAIVRKREERRRKNIIIKAIAAAQKFTHIDVQACWQ